jgi:hypothetical protein
VTSWTFAIDWLGRPTLENHERRNHYMTSHRERQKWKNASIQAVRLKGIPKLELVELTFQARLTEDPLPDPGAIAPSAKGIIDGFVAAGVLPDDSGKYVHAITYLAPRLDPTRSDGIIINILECT